MRHIPVRRPSGAMVVACIALGVALGGTSYATVLNVPNNSVTTTKIANGAVTTPKLRNAAVTQAKLAMNAVTSNRVLNGSLLNADFRPGQLPAGPPGAQGPPGPAGISGLQRFDVATSTSSANSKTVVVTCPTGKRVVGGGARVIGNGAGVVSIIENFPDSDGNKWNGKANEVVATGQTWQLQAYALCATVAA
jgi:hypothetical protein